MYLDIAAILFALGALGGLFMAVLIFSNRTIPVALPVLHGILVASGLVLLLIGVLSGIGGAARTALLLMVIAALGGFFLLSFHIREKSHPKAVVVIHALVAVAGFLTLLSAILRVT